MSLIALLVFGLMIGLPTQAEELEPEPELTESDRDHWAFYPLVRPEVPEVQNPIWPRNPIDRFILARMEAAELSPMPEADRVTLIRRVTFDLTGLPPLPADVNLFINDPHPAAYEALVERLLASPEHGVRWGQHWLDLARFAETDGFEHDHVRPEAWRYRDWVVDALNADLPYDQFVKLQLAGDELEPNNPAAAIATGFLLCGPDMPDINLQEERRHTVLNEMASTVGSVFLAMQLGCAQCHDHKFDPISQRDFYRLRTFFENAEIFRDHPIPSAADIAQRKRQEAERNRLLEILETQIGELEQAALKRAPKTENPDLTLDYEKLLKEHLTAAERKQHKTLTAEWERARKQPLPDFPKGRVMKERTGQRKPGYLWVRGDFRRQGPEMQLAFLRVANPSNAAPLKSESPRLALAKWITRPDHPLTARVMANRLWQHHFGQGLSDSPSDFGIMGQEPTHPELLDWLATELANGWSLKHLHRLLVTSATYRQASHPHNPRWSEPQNQAALETWKAAMENDPDNELLTRMRRRRLEGEAIRDAMLFAAGTLATRRNGPGVRPPLPPELVSTLLKNQWPVTKDEADHNRRSLYLFVRRNLRFPIFDVFDQPDTNSSCAQRARSTIAPQALTMLNSELSLAASRQLAERILAQPRLSVPERIEACFLRVFSREPTEAEINVAEAFLQNQADRHQAAAWVDFCLALFNTNEFLYVD